MIILEILVTAVSHHPQAILLSRRPISLNQRNFGLKVFEGLCDEARTLLPKEHRDLWDFTVIDGPLIDATLSMYWADYRDGANKAKLHIGFDLNCSIPRKIFLTDGRDDERPFVSQILSAGQTGILDRYYHCHKNFDQWQQEGTHFVCRIRNKTKKTVIRANKVTPGSIVFYDAVDLCGTRGGCPRMRNSILVIQYIVVRYKVNLNMMWSKSLNSHSRTGS